MSLKGKKTKIGVLYKGYLKVCLSFIHILPVYNITKKPIFIFTSSRSGSTLLLKMIYSQPNVDFIDLPLNYYDLNLNIIRLPPIPNKNRFISLNLEQEQILKRYFYDLLNAKVKSKNQLDLFDPDFSFNVDRFVIRDMMAKTLIDWFSKNFDIDIIYLLRHPIPRALSLINVNWGINTTDAYLQDNQFKTQFLDEEKIRYSYKIFHEGSYLEKYVLEWCLDNLSPISIYKKRDWLTITYEELVLRTKETIDLICNHFDLSEPSDMYSRYSKPSKTALKTSKDDIKRYGPQCIVYRWLNQIESSEKKKIQEILNVFNIDIYNSDSVFPHQEICNFGSFDI